MKKFIKALLDLLYTIAVLSISWLLCWGAMKILIKYFSATLN